MASKRRKDFIAYKGETWTLTARDLTDSAGNNIDLTGHTLVMTFKDQDKVELETYTFLVDAMPVTIKVTVDEVETWPLGNNNYDLKDIAPNGDVRFLAYGRMTVMEVE